MADYGIADLTAADVLVIPGGPGDAQVRQNPQVLEWIRTIHEKTTWTTSVCTGALILGAAGGVREAALDGSASPRRATSVDGKGQNI